MQKTKVVAVVGPTAAGKTKLAVALAKALEGEVVSFDSMQIYQGMDIATAKPTPEEMEGIPHHLVDFLPPEAPYSVAQFLVDAKAAIADITARGKLPILVGGTGLYLDTLLQGIRFTEQPEAEAALVREKWRSRAALEGKEAMHTLLAVQDPDYAATLHPNNAGRVLRALEHIELTGITMTEQLRRSRELPSEYAAVRIGICYRDRETLYKRIHQRVDQMEAAGLVAEVTDFYAHHDPKTAAQAIGCKELYPYLQGEKTLADCLALLKQSTRQYAKRQLTWFRRNPDTIWVYHEEYPDFTALAAAAVRQVQENLA